MKRRELLRHGARLGAGLGSGWVLGQAPGLGLPLGLTALFASSSAAAHAVNLPALVARVRPAVVSVGTFRATDAPRYRPRGSGFVVEHPASRGRWIVTNAHVLPKLREDGRSVEPGEVDTTEKQPAELAVAMASAGTQAPAGSPQNRLARRARLLLSDPSRDLAVLEVDGPPLPTLPLSATPAPEGLDVLLMGYPLATTLSLNPVVHRGLVAAVTPLALPTFQPGELNPRLLNRLRAGNFEVYQLDATAYPGNSGGPVLDAETGAVIGVVSMVLVRGTRESAVTQPSGITFAIPASQVAELLATVAASGAPSR